VKSKVLHSYKLLVEVNETEGDSEYIIDPLNKDFTSDIVTKLRSKFVSEFAIEDIKANPPLAKLDPPVVY
jgi:hypothetical protein